MLFLLLLSIVFAKHSEPKCKSAFCSECENDVCTNCIHGYILEEGECKFMREVIEHCHHAYNGTCYQCFHGYYLNENQCVKRDPKCQKYENGTCTQCVEGSALIENECKKCAVAGCTNCTGDINTCLGCMHGYTLADNQCVQPVDHCEEYYHHHKHDHDDDDHFKHDKKDDEKRKEEEERDKECLKCYDGYILDHGKCIKIEEKNCRKMENGTCVQCFGPYKPVNGSCTKDESHAKVIDHCVEYDDDEFECEKCEDGYVALHDFDDEDFWPEEDDESKDDHHPDHWPFDDDSEDDHHPDNWPFDDDSEDDHHPDHWPFDDDSKDDHHPEHPSEDPMRPDFPERPSESPEEIPSEDPEMPSEVPEETSEDKHKPDHRPFRMRRPKPIKKHYRQRKTHHHNSGCVKCSAKCETCEGLPSNCLTCSEGYYMKNGQCRTCMSTFKTCEDYKSEEQCYSCNHGCNWVNGTCQYSHCAEYKTVTFEEKTNTPFDKFISYVSNKTYCDKCEEGYVLDAFRRVCVEASVDGCSTYVNGKCVECEAGYFMTKEFKCEKCSESCKTCVYKADICTSCHTTNDTVSETSCMKCWDKNCLVCDESPSVCAECAENYEVDEMGMCSFACHTEDCDKQCITCADNEDGMQIIYPATSSGKCYKYAEMPDEEEDKLNGASSVFIALIALLFFLL